MSSSLTLATNPIITQEFVLLVSEDAHSCFFSQKYDRTVCAGFANMGKEGEPPTIDLVKGSSKSR